MNKIFDAIHIESAIKALESRTNNRIQRGVEGEEKL